MEREAAADPLVHVGVVAHCLCRDGVVNFPDTCPRDFNTLKGTRKLSSTGVVVFRSSELRYVLIQYPVWINFQRRSEKTTKYRGRSGETVRVGLGRYFFPLSICDLES